MSRWCQTWCGGCGAELGAFRKASAGGDLFASHVTYCPIYSGPHDARCGHCALPIRRVGTTWLHLVGGTEECPPGAREIVQNARDTPTR